MAKGRVAIKEIATTDPLSRILPAIEGIQEIQRVSIVEYWQEYDYRHIFTSTNQLNWTHLNFHRHRYNSLIPLLHDLRSLTHLSIFLDLINLQYFLSIIQDFWQLLAFKSKISLDYHDDLSIPVNISSNPHIRVLEIVGIFWYNLVSEYY
jgi:hypothetical protein